MPLERRFDDLKSMIVERIDMSSVKGIVIREYEPADYSQLLKIAKALPEWFTKNGIAKMQIDLRFQRGYVAVLDSKLVGFLSFFTVEGDGQIGWMGVLPDYQRRGIGSKLLNHLIAELRGAGVKTLLVNTLGDSVDYAPYERTRTFYRKEGFRAYKSFYQDNPECPEQLIMKMCI